MISDERRPYHLDATLLAGDGERFYTLLDTAPDAMVIADENGVIEFVNLQTEKLFGYRRDELLGQPIELLIPERFRPVHVAHRSRYTGAAKARPMGSGLELFGRRKDGAEIAIEVSLSPLRTSSGMITSAAIRDITERKRMEAAAKLISDRLVSAVESIQDAFALFDADDRLVLCNSVFRRSLAVAAGPAVGMTFAEILDLNLAHGFYDLGGESVEDFRRRRLSYRANPQGALDIRTADGRSWRITERRTGEGGIVTTIWDLTEDVQRQLELDQARSTAEAASRAKTEFLSSMSHELRTPLNAVLGFAQLLQRDKKPPLTDRQLGMLDHVVKGGEHLLRLIDEVLDLSRIEAGGISLSPEPVDVGDVLREVKMTLGPMASRAGVELAISAIPVDLPPILADRTRFAQILMNYGSNAIKYGRRGGHATLRAESAPPYVRVVVTDDGIGIAEDKHGKIFQPFQRAGQETGPIEGTGIGLTITKRLAEMMKGEVGFRSTAGQGSDFWVELPAHRAPQIAPADAALAARTRGSALASPDGPVYVVVYIEDNPSNVAFMQALLGTYERVRLLTAPTAEIGIEIVRAHRPALVIMDINLPGMSGFEALRRLREWPETREIPVIALSAAAMERDTKRAERSGFARYLTKPVKVDELSAVLESLLAPSEA